MAKGDETRRLILQRGVETAYRIGLGGLTIGSLAVVTGLSKSGLYAHFRSKQALQLAVLTEARTDFGDRVVRPALAIPRGIPRLRALFEHWSSWAAVGRPGCCLFVKAANEFDQQEGPVRDELVQAHQDLLDSIAQIARTGISEGHFRPDTDPEQLATDLYGIMLAFYLSSQLLADPNAERRARQAFERLLADAG
ncbi:TetR/AcrR family transcriptional regulator [Microlunatus sp. GCM10028923]|uniref:TetR/AcrR family transcriptional regulator n=1 Tax=Microlunatus sp. GCM10028923 TaxID=3273400 RepID=UPI0036241CC3